MSDEDRIDELYAEWLMTRTDACIYNGDTLVLHMERRWGWDEFVAQLPEALAQTAKDL